MRRRKNRGSMIIEVTILMPVFLLCVVLYIYAFLYYVKTAEQMAFVSEQLYVKEEFVPDSMRECSIQMYQQEGTDIATSQGRYRYTDIRVEMKKDAGNPIRNLRRWQGIADAVNQRGDS